MKTSNINTLFLSTLLFLGAVDDVQDDVVTIELTGTDQESVVMQIDSFLFPCEISEGDYFHIIILNDVTEIRCGEPEPN
ncbi:MAG: hypothetical protein H8E12_07990 [Rhodobacteraceae bacterium]|nr:hypothetical protein [Paracoccaceae bacterium]